MKVKMCALVNGRDDSIAFEMSVVDVTPDEYLDRKHYKLMKEQVESNGMECLTVFCERERAATQIQELNDFFAW